VTKQLKAKICVLIALLCLALSQIACDSKITDAAAVRAGTGGAAIQSAAQGVSQ